MFSFSISVPRMMSKEIGNVTHESHFAFEYSVVGANNIAVASASAQAHAQSLNASTHAHTQSLSVGTLLPFQAQIVYKRSSDGARCLRVITKCVRVAATRAQAEAAVNVPTLALFVLQHR